MAGDGLRVLGDELLTTHRVLAVDGLEVPVERGLGIDDHAAIVRESHHHVGPAARVAARHPPLRDEVRVHDHAGGLQHASQLHLAPGTPDSVVLHRRGQAASLCANLLVGDAQVPNRCAEHSRLSLALLLQLSETLCVLAQLRDDGLALRRPTQLGGLFDRPVAGLGELEELPGLFGHGLRRHRPEHLQQLVVGVGCGRGVCQLLAQLRLAFGRAGQVGPVPTECRRGRTRVPDRGADAHADPQCQEGEQDRCRRHDSTLTTPCDSEPAAAPAPAPAQAPGSPPAQHQGRATASDPHGRFRPDGAAGRSPAVPRPTAPGQDPSEVRGCAARRPRRRSPAP